MMIIKQVTTQHIILDISPNRLREIAIAIELNPGNVIEENKFVHREENDNQDIMIEVQFVSSEEKDMRLN